MSKELWHKRQKKNDFWAWESNNCLYIPSIVDLFDVGTKFPRVGEKGLNGSIWTGIITRYNGQQYIQAVNSSQLTAYTLTEQYKSGEGANTYIEV